MKSITWKEWVLIPMSIATGIGCLMIITAVYPAIVNSITLSCGIVCICAAASFIGGYFLINNSK